MKDKLHGIASKFEKDLDENGFFLSNLASKSSPLPKLINTLLLASTLSGALSGMAQAHPQIDNVDEDDMYSVVRHDLSNPDETIARLIDEYQEHSKELDSDNLKHISEGHSGSYTLPSGEILFVFNKNDIQLSSPSDSIDLQSALYSNNEYFMKMQGSGASHASINENGKEIGYGIAKVGFNDYSTHIKDFTTKYPLLAKHEKLLIAAHEISHAMLEMKTVSDKIDNAYLGQKENVLINEAFADLNSLVIVAKAEKLQLSEFIDLAEELSSLRIEGSNRLDSHHGTFFALEHLIHAVKENPSIFSEMTSLDLNETANFAANLAHQSTVDLAKNTDYKLKKVFTFKDMEKDANYFAEHGHHSPESKIHPVHNMQLKASWENAIEKLAVRKDELGSFNSAIKENRGLYKSIIGLGWHASALNEHISDYYTDSFENTDFVKASLKLAKSSINQNQSIASTYEL